jgi:hypothetical protein
LEIPNSFDLNRAAEFLKLAKSHDTNLWLMFEDVEKPWESLEKLITSEKKFLVRTDKKGRPWKTHNTDVRDTIQGIMLALKKGTL